MSTPRKTYRVRMHIWLVMDATVRTTSADRAETIAMRRWSYSPSGTISFPGLRFRHYAFYRIDTEESQA